MNDISGWNHECAGKNCKRPGVNILTISFINRKGIFCESCTKYLLEHGLATAHDKDKKFSQALECVRTLGSNAETNHRTSNPNDGQAHSTEEGNKYSHNGGCYFLTPNA